MRSILIKFWIVNVDYRIIFFLSDIML